MDKGKIREPYLDIAKGIGILFVVFGHSFPDENSLMGISNVYCQLIKDIIYSFHMPLFFLISGYLSISVIGNKKKLIEKGIHFLIPYLTMSILYIPLRLFASGMALSDWSVKDTWKILVGVSPNGGVWFLYVLFLANIIAFCIYTQKIIIVILLVSAVMSILAKGEYVIFEYSILNYLFANLFFFCLGLFTRQYIGDVKKYLEETRVVCYVGLFCLLWIIYRHFNTGILMCILGILGSLIVLGCSLKISGKNSNAVLRLLGHGSMYIYLFHGPIQVVVRYIFWSKLQVNYYLCVLLMFITGVSGAIIMRYVIMKFPRLDGLFSGNLGYKNQI